MKLGTYLGIVVAMALALCGCYTPPPVTALGRPEVKIVDYADIPRRHVIPAKTQFYRTDIVAICVNGFAGRTVTMEVTEKQRGIVKTWTQYIHPPHVKTRSVGMMYQDNLGMLHNDTRRDESHVEQDYVVHWTQPPPGTYDVRVVSNEGIVQQASFSVSN